MHPLYYLNPVIGSVAECFRLLHRDITYQCRLHGTVFLQLDDRISDGGRSIQVDRRWIRPVKKRVFLDAYFHADNEPPLISGSQYGVFNGFEFDHPVVFGIIGKSLLSGHGGGTCIAVVRKDRGLIRKYSSTANAKAIRRELIEQGRLAYSLQR